MLAAAIRRETGRETTFTLATRDMNRLAIQSLLLGAQVLGLENVVVVQGDQFNDRDRALLAVNGYRPTELIARFPPNEGTDFRGQSPQEPTSVCIGATYDLARGERTRRPTDCPERWRLAPISDGSASTGGCAPLQEACDGRTASH